MPELDPVDAPEAASLAREPRRLPAWVRYPVTVLLGALLAALASYLLRKIGF